MTWGKRRLAKVKANLAKMDIHLQNVEKQLITHPPVCPMCDNPLRLGFLDGVYNNLVWVPIGNKIPFGGHQWYPLPSYICKTCHLTITQYKTTSNMDNGCVVLIKEMEKGLDNCPYCNRKQLKGYVFGTGGISTEPYVFWIEKDRRKFWREKVYLTAYPFLTLTLQKIPTYQCIKCGIWFSHYKPNKIAKTNIVGIIGWVAFFIIILLSSFIVNMFIQ